jgi:hypothetical protein
MPFEPAEIVPELLMPPVKLDMVRVVREALPPTQMPLPALLPKPKPKTGAEMVPELLMPPSKVAVLSTTIALPKVDMIVPALLMPPEKTESLIEIAVRLYEATALVRSIEMPPPIVPESAIPSTVAVMVLPFVSAMPLGLIVPELAMVPVMVELLMAMPMIVAVLLQPPVVVLE